MKKVGRAGGFGRGIEFPAHSGSEGEPRRDLPGVLRPQRQFGDVGGGIDRGRTAEPEIAPVGKRGDVVGNCAEDAHRVAPDGFHTAVVGAQVEGVGSGLPAGRFHHLELALPARAFAARHYLSHASDGKPHERVAGCGAGEQVGREGLEIAARKHRSTGFLPTGFRFGLRLVGAEIENPLRGGPEVQAEGQAPEAKVETVDFRAAEFVERGGIVVAAEHGGARRQSVIDAQRAGIELRRAGVAAVPEGEAVAQRDSVGLGIEIERWLDPVRRRGAGGIGRHGLAEHVGATQREVLVGSEEEGMVAADGAAERRGHIVQPQRAALLAREVGEPIVGGERFMPQAIDHRAVELVGSGAAGERDACAGEPPRLVDRRRGLQAELVDCFQGKQGIQTAEGAHRRQHAAGGLRGQSAGGDPGVGAGAIHGEVVGVGTLAVGAELSRPRRAWPASRWCRAQAPAVPECRGR